MSALLRTEQTCWRLETSHRVGVIVDGAGYYRSLREAMKRARRRIQIVGWDIDTRMKMIRGDASDDDPAELGAFLGVLLERRPALEIGVLIWDFHPVYALERQWVSVFTWPEKASDRLRYHADGSHPVGASQHQKIVVVDDALAFVGGFDLSKWRWDTPQHEEGDPRRTDPAGDEYPPFHDLAFLVDGDAAGALADLVADRWRRATDHHPEPVEPDPAHDPWPLEVTPRWRDVEIGIARTYPPFGGRSEIREVERLYEAAIAAAESTIYLENQYLTSHCVASNLERRLREPDGPEVVVVLPRATGGWLEQVTMDVLRARVLSRLRAADEHGRLAVFCPVSGDADVMVHAKLMIVDDRLLRIGSANLSNRSLGFDSECDLAIEADPESEEAEEIVRLRCELLAEHLGSSPEEVAACFEEKGSLLRTIEHLGGGDRRLEPLDGSVDRELDELVPDAAILDPERPVKVDRLARELAPPEESSDSSRGWWRLAAATAVIAGLALSWRFTPLRQWLDPERLLAFLEGLRAWPASELLLLMLYLLGGVLVAPVTVLNVATIVTFGTLEGLLLAALGSELSALALYGLGAWMGQPTIERVAGKRLRPITRALGRQGILGVVAVRLIPVAPYSVINLVAGAVRLGFWAFALGTILGLAPSLLAVAFFSDRLRAVLESPDPETLTWLALAVLLLLALGFGLRALVRHLSRTSSDPA